MGASYCCVMGWEGETVQPLTLLAPFHGMWLRNVQKKYFVQISNASVTSRHNTTRLSTYSESYLDTGSP